MDVDDFADQKMKENLVLLLCDSCRSKKYFKHFLDVVFLQARARREEIKECQRRMDEMEKHFNSLIAELTGKRRN